MKDRVITMDIEITKSNRNKKVYADFHGMRYTRNIDGKLGQWKFSGTAERSRVKNRQVNWNADLVDDKGRHQTSALSYPLVGMQSLNDPDYIEYQILSAKTANIDGFMVEWGFPEHDANSELQKMLPIAAKYNFEIGINWCDAWHFYNWIEEVHPDIKSREDKVEYFKKSLQYLIDHVYGANTGVLFDGHPILFMFGGGPTAEEFKDIKEHQYKLPDAIKSPLFFGRAPIEGQSKEGIVEYHFCSNAWFDEKNSDGKRLLDGAFCWIPTRVRRGEGGAFENWDRYATKEDSVSYINTFMESTENQKEQFVLRISSVCPEMDNRGCASWGKHDLSHIPRESGETYRMMWDFNVKNKDKLDIVFVVSWNDFTERHQIEPTVEDGDRELRITEEYAAGFKEIISDSTGIGLPLKLFRCRKKSSFLKSSEVDTSKVDDVLEKAAVEISEKKYKEAAEHIADVEDILRRMENCVHKQFISINVPFKDLIDVYTSSLIDNIGDEIWDMSSGVYISFSEELAAILRKNNYLGWLCFDYLDQGNGNFIVQTHTERINTFNGDFSIVCDIRRDDTGSWKRAKVKVFKGNSSFKHGLEHNADFIFKGTGLVKNIKYEFEVIKKEE